MYFLRNDQANKKLAIIQEQRKILYDSCDNCKEKKETRRCLKFF